MGTSSFLCTPKDRSAQTKHTFNMKFFVAVAALIASTVAVPIEDTAEVKEAKEMFMKSFDAAKMGEHAKLAPVQGPTMYMDDTEDVMKAKEDFEKTFDMFEKGMAPKPIHTLPYAMPYYHHTVASYAYPTTYSYQYAPYYHF